MALLRRLLILPPLVAGLALAYWVTSGRTPPEVATPEERRVAVAYVVASPRTFVPSVTGFGAVAPARTWEAVAQVKGRVEHVHPNFIRGGNLREGEVVVRIAAEDYELAVAQAEANIESAASQIQEMQLSADTTQASL
ncbi:MAG: hemolysin D, partial [Pseudomonadota bacterium]